MAAPRRPTPNVAAMSDLPRLPRRTSRRRRPAASRRRPATSPTAGTATPADPCSSSAGSPSGSSACSSCVLALQLAQPACCSSRCAARRSTSSDGTITLNDFDGKLGLYVAISGIAAAVGLALLVVQIIWTCRMAKNLGALGRQGQSFKPGAHHRRSTSSAAARSASSTSSCGASCGRAATPRAPRATPTGSAGRTVSIVVAHLVATLVAVVVGFASVRAGAGQRHPHATRRTTWPRTYPTSSASCIAGGLLQIAVAVIFIMLVRQLAARHMKAIGEAD